MPDTLHPKADSNSPFRQGGMPTLKCAEGPGVIKPADVNPIRRESCCVTSASKEDSGHDVREASFLSTPGTELSTVSNIFSDYERDALTSDTEEESDDNDVAKGIASPTRCRRKISTYRVSSSNTSRHATANTDTVPSELSSESSASAHDNLSIEKRNSTASLASYGNRGAENTFLKKRNDGFPCSQEVDKKMMGHFKKPVNILEKGQVYVVQLIDQSDYVRVWKTSNFDKHKKQEKSWGRCLSKQSGEYKVNSKLVSGYKLWAKLMQCELSPVGYQFICSACEKTGTGHNGIFKADFEKVLEIHQRWFNWLELEPYDQSGKLKLGWHHRLHRLIDTYDHVPAAAPEWDFEQSKKRWDEFAQTPLGTGPEALEIIQCKTCQEYLPSLGSSAEPGGPQPQEKLTDTKTENGRGSTSRTSEVFRTMKAKVKKVLAPKWNGQLGDCEGETQ